MASSMWLSAERILLSARVLALLFFLYSSLSITLRSVVALLLLLGLLCCIAAAVVLFDLGNALVTVYATERRKNADSESSPFRQLRKSGTDVSPELVKAYSEKIVHFVSYDAESSETLQNFRPVQRNTHCIFSKTAKIWGAQPWKDNLTFEENVHRSIPMLIKFLATGKFLALDGFLFELPATEYGKSPTVFGQGVNRLLRCLSDADPAGVHCMNKSYVSGRGWYFEFDKESIFVTTFAPCYPSSHSRYSFGATSCYVLFQPEYSFAIHDIEPDTPETNWECPKTIRDKIRVAYKKNGQEYLIKDTVYYPPAHDIVKPLGLHQEPVEWWKTDNR
eukprot:m.53655 g.53655  ORF g.53655 m.53655 type:complete len:334 (+) comp34273_c0_seq5:31-1032(+)